MDPVLFPVPVEMMGWGGWPIYAPYNYRKFKNSARNCKMMSLKLKLKCPHCKMIFIETFGDEPDTKTICFYCNMEIKVLSNEVSDSYEKPHREN